ncbi:MAG TPA: CheR family methyltransferase, partial [Terriglobia bacterium]|nr:CheR family methyltransferase [Terriglobia bacterium]
EGVYGEWSFRSTPPWVRSRYFTPTTDGRWVIAPSIKKMVTFAYLNLIEDANPSPLSSTNAMNVILCRNVLMYFTPPAMKKVVHHFYRSLADGGWLIVSPTEASHTLFSEFSTVSFTGAMLYRKADRHPQAARTFHSGHAGGQDEEILCGLPPPTMIEYHGPAGTGMPQIDQGPSVGAVEPSEAELPPISYAEAVGLYQQGRYEDAEAIIVALLSQNPGDGQAMLLLARLSANQGRLAEALACCEKAIASDKMNARAHYLRAMILQEQGWLEGAALAVKRALYLEPEFALGHFALGNIALRLGKVKESKKHFENTLALLAKYQPDDILPESEALTAGRLSALIALQKRPGDARGVGVKGTPLAGGEQSYSGHPLL